LETFYLVESTRSETALIEARFGLQPLQTRDANAYNLLDGLDFTQKARDPAFG
jgi:phospholipase C